MSCRKSADKGGGGWQRQLGLKRIPALIVPAEGEAEEYGKIFVGEPYEVDSEASRAAGIFAEYLQLIEIAKAQLANSDENA